MRVRLNSIRFQKKWEGAASRTFSDSFVALLWLQNANLRKREKTLGPASTHGVSAMAEIARQMRRLSGSIGAPARKDVLTANSDDRIAPTHAEVAGQESRPTSDQAKKNLRGAPRQSGGKLNIMSPETGKRNRCYL